MRKNKQLLVPLSFLGIILIAILAFYLSLDFRFTTEKKLNNFPIPKNADLVSENKWFLNYDTKSVSAEEGPGYSYSLKLKKDGWKTKKIEGQGYVYERGNTSIEMDTDDRHMSLKLIK